MVNFGLHILTFLESAKEYFVGQSSEAKKLLDDQMLNFGLDFLEIGKLWSTYFDVFGKTKILSVKFQKQKSYWVIKFWTSVQIFSKM